MYIYMHNVKFKLANVHVVGAQLEIAGVVTFQKLLGLVAKRSVERLNQTAWNDNCSSARDPKAHTPHDEGQKMVGWVPAAQQQYTEEQ